MLYHEPLAHTLVAERRRKAERRRIAADVPERAREAHRVELRRVRASVLLLERSSGEAAQES
jgi:hypothetical protein